MTIDTKMVKLFTGDGRGMFEVSFWRALQIAVLCALLVVAGVAPAQAADRYWIQNGSYSGICIGLQQSSGPNVVIGSCNPLSLSQQWNVSAETVPLKYGDKLLEYHEIANRQTNTCLGVHAASTTSGERLVVGTCQDADEDHSQVWAPYSFDGVTVMINGHSGLCMGTQGSSTVGGTLVVQGNCYWTPTQHWVFAV